MRMFSFNRHRTSTSLVDYHGGKSRERARLLKKVRRKGMWAFVDIPQDQDGNIDDDGECVIHYWHRADQDPRRVIFLLGHELGHIADGGPKHPPGDMAEENRADEFGGVAAVAFGMLLATGLVTRPEVPARASARRSGRRVRSRRGSFVAGRPRR